MPERLEPETTPRYWAALYSPPGARAVLEALLGVEAETRAVLDPERDHQVAHVRLDWWREECERYARGAPAHPATRALLATLSPLVAADLTADPLDGLVAAAQWDLASATFETRSELESYCDRWASAVTQLAAVAAVAASISTVVAISALPALENAREHGRALGRAIAELELLEGLELDARLGRLRLPLDELAEREIDSAALAEPPWPTALCDLIRARHRAARAALSAAVSSLDRQAQAPLRGLLVWAAMAHRRSLRAERALPRAWEPSGPSRVADAWISWRAARRATVGKFSLAPESPA